MSHQKIAQLTAQLKNLPPTSPAAKALRAALVQAKAQLSTATVVSAPPAPVEVSALPPDSEVAPAPSEAAIVVTAPSPIYQAIGLLEAELCQTEDGWYCLEWQGKRWPSALRPSLLKRAPLLLGQRRYWRVYPHVQMSEQGFIVGRFMIIGQPQQVTTRLDGEFLLSGCWQSLHTWQNQSMRPSYFSVYRNPTPDRTSKNVYYQNYVLNHWDEPPFTPKRSHPSPWHLILAELQVDGSFNFIQLLDGPKPAPVRVQRPTEPPAAQSSDRRQLPVSPPPATAISHKNDDTA